MTRRQYTAAALATAAVVVGALVVYNVSKPKYTVYFPQVYNYQETLKSAFGKYGIRFGFAVGASSFENPVTRAIIEQHAAIVTTEGALKMQYTQPEQGFYNFDEGDAIVAYADELDIGVHGHTASWSLQNPNWLKDGTFTEYELEQILASHVSTLSSHYDGKLVSLDAANEGFLSCGPWCPLGTNKYVRLSFDAARAKHPFPEPDGPERQPITPLVYNSIFPTMSEEDKALWLLDAGIIDGIGIQLHLVASADWEAHLARTDAFLEKLKAHDGFARFSEVGVHQHEGQEQAQAVVYAAVTALAVKHSDVVTDFVVWGVRDPAWRGDVTLFNNDGTPKPAYFAIMDALR